MSEKELYSLLCSYKTASHHGKLSKLMKSGKLSGASTRCITQIFKLVIQLSEVEDGVAVAQLIALLAMLLPFKNYQVVDGAVLSSLKALLFHLKGLRKSHYINKIYISFLGIISEVLDANINCKESLPVMFAPVLFNVAMEDTQYFAYDLRMEAAKSLNVLLEDQDGKDVHKHLTSLPEVKTQWLDIGEAVSTSGDFELQVTLMELLCRLLSPSQRKKFAPNLFPEGDALQQLLLQITDAEFEKDCRVFLNSLNGSLQQRMVYSFKCMRVNVGGTDDLDIPPNQNWIDVNFGSKTITMFVMSMSEEGSADYDTLIINPKSVSKHKHTVEGDCFHLVLTLDIPVCHLLHDKKGGDSHTIHFVIDKIPDPKGAILGLLGQYLPESPKLSKMARVDVSEETIQICGNVTRIVSTPVSEREERLSKTRTMLAAKIPDPLPQFVIGSSQPQEQKIRSFIASEPILANPLVPRSSPVEDSVIPSSATAIPDSLPVNVIPEINDCWQLRSSFDFTSGADNSDISIVGDDTIKAFATKNLVKENPEIEEMGSNDNGPPERSKIDRSNIIRHPDSKGTDCKGTSKTDSDELLANNSDTVCEKKYEQFENEFKNTKCELYSDLEREDSNTANKRQSDIITSKSSRKSKRILKKPLKFEELEPPKTVIKVGTTITTESSLIKDAESIKIQNNFEKQERNKEEVEVQITNIVEVEFEEVVEIEGESNDDDEPPLIDMDSKASPKVVSAASPDPSVTEHSPELSQQLDQINYDISSEIPSSPGDVYKEILRDSINDSPAKVVIASNSPFLKKIENNYKRRLMDTEGVFICSQDSQDSKSSQAKRGPAFARKREISSRKSSTFVISNNKTLQNLRERLRKESDEDVPGETIPLPPARRSILKKKFLDKSLLGAPKTPQFGSFDFDLNSPTRGSEKSWEKTCQKKRAAGFKTKRQKLEDQKAAKRQLKAEQKIEKPTKRLTKKRKKDNEGISEGDKNESEVEITAKDKPKLELKKKSPSPPPKTLSTRYSMRRQGKKVNYRDVGSDDNGASVTASEFSTTTNSTVARYLSRTGHVTSPKDSSPKTVSRKTCQDLSSDPEPEVMLANINKSLDEDNIQPELNSSEPGFVATQNKYSVADVKLQRTSCLNKTSDDIAMISALYDDNDIEPQPDNNLEIQQENYLETQPEDDLETQPDNDEDIEESSDSPIIAVEQQEITCIPSTDTTGIPLTFKTDTSSYPSMVSKDPSPIIKTNFFKLPNSQMKSITLNLNPQVRNISPAVQEDQEIDEDDIDVVGKVFEDQILQKETERLDSKSRKYNKHFKKTPKPKKETHSSDMIDITDNLDRIQGSLDHIDQSTVLEVAVTSLSEVQRIVIHENQCSGKDKKLWLAGTPSEYSSDSKEGKQSHTNFKQNIKPFDNEMLSDKFGSLLQHNQITSVAPILVTGNDISEQFKEVSNCMVTEADSSGMLMDIDDYHTPCSPEEKTFDASNIFSNILEESRLAGGKEKSNCPSTLVSTPTKLSHIREAEIANVSPFQQFLETIGGVKSPIQAKGKEKVRKGGFGITAVSEQQESRLHKTIDAGVIGKASDSGLGISCDSELGILHSFGKNMSIPIPVTEISQRRQTNPPTTRSPTTKKSVDISPSIARQKSALSAQSPGRQELEDYYNMLCKTPGKFSQTSSVSPGHVASVLQSQAFSQLSSQGGILPDVQYEIKLSRVCTSPVKHRSVGNRSPEPINDEFDGFSESSSLAIPPFMLDSESGIALQMLQKQSKQMKEKQFQKTKDNIDLIAKDLSCATNRFFNTAESKRRSILKNCTEDVHEKIGNMECELVNIKRKEDTALRGIAQAHKIQKDARIALETKMRLLKESSKLPSMTTDEMDTALIELREILHHQLHRRQKELDKNQIQRQRKQLMKQMAMIMMSEFE